MALLLISGVLPTLHIVRRGVDENIAFLLAGFNIILSDDRQEVVRIVMYYLWCVESESVLFILLYRPFHVVCNIAVCECKRYIHKQQYQVLNIKVQINGVIVSRKERPASELSETSLS